ncbi:hypothetical protein BS47DRAFT_1397780 [Hydnum rufescens UP504]|uniref:Uncharacterized protein n=1 Tax=Hydnum rufescens UP504 TaxID=1448309 RepID=A0A9P6AMD3_9AGAM|nr:hypothetical protein BS47DRAFT_1397780 [Hydnum rufescens UP504]
MGDVPPSGRANGPPRTAVFSPTESGADSSGSFAAIAEMIPPVEWKLPDFYREVTSPNSGLHAFISGDVRDVACYLGVFDYLLMSVHIQNQRVPMRGWSMHPTRRPRKVTRVVTDQYLQLVAI